MSTNAVTFDFSASAYDAPGKSDQERYDTLLAVTRSGYELGFKNVWMAEHNFTDYYPTPSPLLMFANLAGRFPGLGLGTCVIMPAWYDPIRLASEISMLLSLTTEELHLGIGRGTAPIEYLGYNREMRKSETLFDEAMDIVKLALKGQPFTYDGKEFRVPTEVEIRPRPVGADHRIYFYRAVLDPKSPEKAVRGGYHFLGSSWFPYDQAGARLADYDRLLAERGEGDRQKAVWCNTIIADSDEEAKRLGRHHCAEFFKLSVTHYEARTSRTRGFDVGDYLQNDPAYARTGKIFSALKGFAEEGSQANTEFVDRQMIGSPATVRERVRKYLDLGYNRIIVQVDLHTVPRDLQIESLTRFAREVAPEFTDAFESRPNAAE